MQQKMNQWKANRMCASIEAETPSPEQQDVFTKATGRLGAYFCTFCWSLLGVFGQASRRFEGLDLSFASVPLKDRARVRSSPLEWHLTGK